MEFFNVVGVEKLSVEECSRILDFCIKEVLWDVFVVNEIDFDNVVKVVKEVFKFWKGLLLEKRQVYVVVFVEVLLIN